MTARILTRRHAVADDDADHPQILRTIDSYRIVFGVYAQQPDRTTDDLELLEIYRVADATASPYLALGAVVWAGLDGIRNNRALPPPPERDFWEMSEIDREVAGVRPLPRSLDLALENLAGNEAARGYFRHRLTRIKVLEALVTRLDSKQTEAKAEAKAE